MPRQARNFYQNYLLWSNDLSNGLWVKQAGTTVTPNAIANPVNGNVDAWLVDVTAPSVGQGIFQGGIPITNVQIGKNNCKSAWLRGFNGGEVVRLRDPVLGTLFLNCTLTTSWLPFSYVDYGQDGNFGIWFQKSSGNKFYMYNPQLTIANWRGAETITTGARNANPIPNIVSGRVVVLSRAIVSARTLIS